MISRRFLPLLALLAGCASAAPPAPVTPRALPSVELRTLDGQPVRLGDVAAGRPALVSLWATWCEACVRELEALGRLDQATHGASARVIAIAVGEPRDKVAAFVHAHQLGYTQLVDERFQLADALGQTRVPATLVLDRDGTIVYRGGAFDEAALAALRRTIEPTQAKR